MTRLTSTQLNQAMVDALGDRVLAIGALGNPAFEVDLAAPLPGHLRVYLFNATNPKGGRSVTAPEHKIQLHVPGQAKKQRANFDTSGGRIVLLAGKVEDADEWVLWDADLYRDFANFANVQVKTATIEAARFAGAIRTQSRRPTLGPETVIVTPSALLAEAIAMRFAPGHPPAAPATAPAPQTGGKPYVPPAREGQAEPETRVFEVDPDLIDRGTTAHKDIQDALAGELAARGLDPLSPQPGDPQFDLAWVQDDVAFVTEVKSLTDKNEEHQLRLGLGQLLSYVHRIEWPDVDVVRGVLAVERPPTADYWADLCSNHDVILTWPGAFGDLFVEGV